MTAYISRPSHQMAAIFSCDKCSDAYTTPADLDRHRQIHDFNYDPRRFASPVNRSRSRSETVGHARVEQVAATPVVAARCFFFCSTCNTRVDSLSCLEKHNEQYHQPTSINNKNAIPEGHTPQSPREIPSPEPSSNPSSAFGTPTSWEQGIHTQSVQPISYSPTGPAHLPNSSPNSVAAVSSPQYVAHMPPDSASEASLAGDVRWIDFLVPIEGREPCSQFVEYGDSNLSPLSDRFWPRPIDMQLSGYHFPREVLEVSLDSLRLLFEAGGVPRVYEAVEAQSPFLPAINLLNQLCGNYFALWQPNQPVFHSATWNFIEYPMALVSAMACVGSTFTQDSQILRQANYISQRCIAEINRLVSLEFPAGGMISFYKHNVLTPNRPKALRSTKTLST